MRRLTDGPNWRISLLRADARKGDVYFTACRDASVRQCLYKVNAKGQITALTDTSMNVSAVSFSPDGKYFAAALSNFTTPTQIRVCRSSDGKGQVVADKKGPDYDASKYALPQLIYITVDNGLKLPAYIVYPKNFDPSRKYPVHVDIYGGPDTPQVRDVWMQPSDRNQWWSENDIIEVTADCRAAGHNGRAGLDMVYKHLNTYEVQDFISWAKYLKSLPYVDGDKIGVEGFSFGGTMTCMLLFTAPEYFHYGIAGGGVYDWILYDTHYTERFMETPQTNPEGYRDSKVIKYVPEYPVVYDAASASAAEAGKIEPVMLKITHGTGDDNVHFQSTLQLIDALHQYNKKFEFMIYPDGMHGYHGYQGNHFLNSNREFWLKYLCGKKAE